MIRKKELLPTNGEVRVWLLATLRHSDQVASRRDVAPRREKLTNAISTK